MRSIPGRLDLSLLRFLGLSGSTAGRDVEPASLVAISARLEALPDEESRFIAAFAYLLARIAGADLRTDQAEREAITARLEALAKIAHDQATLLAETAIQAAKSHSASDDHLVARAFRDMTEDPERIRLLRCLYAVAAADQHISTREDNEIFEIANAIGVRRLDIIALRSEFREQLGTLKTLPRER